MTCHLGCQGAIGFIHAETQTTLCLNHAARESCVCGTLVEHCWLTGCGAWQPATPQIALAVRQDYLTDVPTLH